MAKPDRRPPGRGPRRPETRAGALPVAGPPPPGGASDEAPELQALRAASAGLQYPLSESDAPFDVFRWPAAPAGGGDTGREQVAARSGAGRTVEEVPVDRFFAQLEGAEDAERFRQLRRVLEAQLTGLQVLRVPGQDAEVDVYLVGRARADNWVGLHTTSVET